MVPATIPLLTLMIPAILSALSVVREKETGSIINLYVTPLTRTEFLLGKQMPYLLFAVLSSALLTVMAVTVFNVPIKGSSFVLFLATAHLFPDHLINLPVIYSILKEVAFCCLPQIHFSAKVHEKEITLGPFAFKAAVKCPETHSLQFNYANIRNTHGLLPITSPSFFHAATFFVLI